jgi:hypothetical protein
MTPKKPFDGMSVFEGNVYFWEMKFSKGLKALNIKKLADHQRDALQDIGLNSSKNVYPIVVYFVYKPRELKEFYFIYSSYLEINESISKKEFLEFKEQGFAYHIYKQETINKKGERVKIDICNVSNIKIIGVYR